MGNAATANNYDMNLKRFSVVWAKLPNPTDESRHVNSGIHPCVIISNDMYNRFSPNVTIISMTSKDKKKLPTHLTLSRKESMSIGLNKPSTIMAESITSIGKRAIIGKIGDISEELQEEIMKIIAVQLEM